MSGIDCDTRSTAAVVLDEASPALQQLAQQMLVWAIDTPANRSAVEKVWSGAGQPANNLTLFKIRDFDSKESACISNLPVIKLHHPEVVLLMLIGASDCPSFRASLRAEGYSLETKGNVLLAHKGEN